MPVFCSQEAQLRLFFLAAMGVLFMAPRIVLRPIFWLNSYECGNILFNDALTTFYLRLYGVRHMVKDHSDIERGYSLPPHRQGFFYLHHPTHRIIHTTAVVTPVVVHWLDRELAQWVLPMKDRSDDQSNHERTLLPRSYISLHERGVQSEKV